MFDFTDASAAYLESIRQELPLYDRLQDELVKATYGVSVKRILDLGAGTGETSRRCLEAYPDAELIGIDPSEALLRIARGVLGEKAQLRLGYLSEPLPKGHFDLIVSALSIHDLSVADQSTLYARVKRSLSSRGRFVIADLVSHETSSSAPSPPSVRPLVRMDALLGRLRDAGLHPEITWAESDLAVVAAGTERRPAPR